MEMRYKWEVKEEGLGAGRCRRGHKERKNWKGRTGAGWERENCKLVIYNGRTTRDGNCERLHAKKQ